uniref:tRNA (uracil-O(2)-)-methyltransferase n=1 Tax=Caenorhabditis tropicalis TaxID=1561998 RepID=A0A1I7TEX0_9PELO
MSQGATIWRIIVEETAEYEETVDVKAYFDKIISLWKEYPKAISSRVTASIPVDEGSHLWNEVISCFEQKHRFSPRDCSEISVNKFICRYTDPTKARKFSENAFEVSFYQEELLVRFYPIVLDGHTHPHFEEPYQIGCRSSSESSIHLQFFKPIDLADEYYEYLKTQGFKTIITWLKGIDLSKTSRKTNSLLDKESYFRTYRHIREDYGRALVEQWTENSNPQKTVFEDCGITAYINEIVRMDILPKPKKFVDIGCGNGVLVHLLNLTGMKGYGVDVRSRQIWNTTLKHVDLRESVVEPQVVVENEPHFDSDVDLLVGNHSDELTPWIPVMAAKLNCNFFLIPCCPFNFFGKYVNDGSHIGPKRLVSQYESFFEWTVTVAERLGFKVDLDRLAIPSTKRLCIIGRVPEKGLCTDLDETINQMTRGQKFVARPKEIKMNNCTTIPVNERDRMAKLLFDYILSSSNETRDGWRCGGEVPLRELATVLTEEDKKLMKDQDGGLQTFLRNHHQIFHVFKATARIRDFRQPKVSRSRPDWKKKANKDGKPNNPPRKSPCWMALYHPDGCPLGPEKCQFQH